MNKLNKIIIASDPAMILSFKLFMEDSFGYYEYLEEGGLSSIEGLDDLIFIFLEDYRERSDIDVIMKYAVDNDCKTIYLAYGNIIQCKLH